MGFRFELEHASAVAYVTIPNEVTPPTLTLQQLGDFLRSLESNDNGEGTPCLWSEDRDWVEHIRRLASHSLKVLQTLDRNWHEVLEADTIAKILRPLKLEFSKFKIYGLAIGSFKSHDRLEAFCVHAAYSSGHNGLFIIPTFPAPEETLNLFRPNPMTRVIATRPDLWPGVLFWTPDGTSAFAPLAEAYGLCNDIY